jgi:hypothetical protein
MNILRRLAINFKNRIRKYLKYFIILLLTLCHHISLSKDDNLNLLHLFHEYIK